MILKVRLLSPFYSIEIPSLIITPSLTVALVVEDTEEVEINMNGKPFIATKFASSLRRQLWKQHLGLISPQDCPASGDEFETDAMKPVGFPQEKVTNSEDDKLVEDPLGEELEALMISTASHNAQIFNGEFLCHILSVDSTETIHIVLDVFHAVPSPDVEEWNSYVAFVPQAPMMPGHVARQDMPLQYIKENLSRVRGHLVTMPLNFLKKEDLMALDSAVNPLTLSIYL